MQYVKTIENLLNSMTHYTTECTPTELHFGKPLHDEILKYIQFPENKPLKKILYYIREKKTLKRTLQDDQKIKKYPK